MRKLDYCLTYGDTDECIMHYFINNTEKECVQVYQAGHLNALVENYDLSIKDLSEILENFVDDIEYTTVGR